MNQKDFEDVLSTFTDVYNAIYGLLNEKMTLLYMVLERMEKK
tara:strand:+ start:118 stop:243 length:126 start_codon:yes stop_codon:yes gene_type:complete